MLGLMPSRSFLAAFATTSSSPLVVVLRQLGMTLTFSSGAAITPDVPCFCSGTGTTVLIYSTLSFWKSVTIPDWSFVLRYNCTAIICKFVSTLKCFVLGTVNATAFENVARLPRHLGVPWHSTARRGVENLHLPETRFAAQRRSDLRREKSAPNTSWTWSVL
ncbi:hypothetical protein BDV98DRAFT_5620 [Pterulicium gracile]|uniref:Uncharacterized protein n=1 Tax=Pterulicium gracile TaxID=1884261 RepID=A0A5C3QYA4_9AGAR|nr:hypothetical protein BDV98DRAFT_5620 [Pterula gracilis]